MAFWVNFFFKFMLNKIITIQKHKVRQELAHKLLLSGCPGSFIATLHMSLSSSEGLKLLTVFQVEEFFDVSRPLLLIQCQA